jgi:hypothetical protein
LFKIASAMIDRAELPVHRKNTLYSSAMAYLSGTDCVATGSPPNHAGCFTMAVVPIKASSKQMTLICNSRKPRSPLQH